MSIEVLHTTTLLIYIYIRPKKEFGKKRMRFRLSIMFGVFGMDSGGCTDELWHFFAHVQWFSTEILEQMIVTSLYDVMRVSPVIFGGNIKGEHDQARGWAATAITVVRVF